MKEEAKQAYHKRKKTESHQETNLQKLSDKQQLDLRNEIAEFYSDKPPSFHTKVQYALTKKSVENVSGTKKSSPYEQLWIIDNLRIQNTFKKYKYLRPIGEYIHYKNIGPKNVELEEHLDNVLEVTNCDIDLLYQKYDKKIGDSRPKSIYLLNDDFYKEIALSNSLIITLYDESQREVSSLFYNQSPFPLVRRKGIKGG